MLPGDHPPGEAQGQKVAGTLTRRTFGGSAGGGDGRDQFLVAGTLGACKGGWSDDLDRCGAFVTGPLTVGGGGFNGQDAYNDLLVTPFDPTQITSKTNRSKPRKGSPCHTLSRGAHPPAVAFNPQSAGDCRGLDPKPVVSALNRSQKAAVAFNLRGREGGAMPEVADRASVRASAGGSSRSYVANGGVRRLTPRECERLQGFPDDWTEGHADAARYRMMGNAVAVPCAQWIGKRLVRVHQRYAALFEAERRRVFGTEHHPATRFA